jgi:hypothetical protein
MFMIKTKIVVTGESSPPMRNSAFTGVAAFCPKGTRGALAGLLVAFSALALLFTAPVSVAQDSKQPAATQSTPPATSPAAVEPAPQNSTPVNACASPAPSSGKALVCVYRQSRAVGSAAHDNLFINGVFLAKLLNGEYASMEVAPGHVVVSGVARMYYGPSVIMSSAAAANQTRKETERFHFDAEAGKTYYLKWTSGMFASGITVTPMDPKTGAKELGKLHPSKNTDPKEVAKDEGKEGGK